MFTGVRAARVDPGLALGEYDEGVEEAAAMFGGGAEVAAYRAELFRSVSVRRQRDTFCLTLIMRMSRSDPLLSAGMCQSVVTRR